MHPSIHTYIYTSHKKQSKENLTNAGCGDSVDWTEEYIVVLFGYRYDMSSGARVGLYLWLDRNTTISGQKLLIHYSYRRCYRVVCGWRVEPPHTWRVERGVWSHHTLSIYSRDRTELMYAFYCIIHEGNNTNGVLDCNIQHTYIQNTASS